MRKCCLSWCVAAPPPSGHGRHAQSFASQLTMSWRGVGGGVSKTLGTPQGRTGVCVWRPARPLGAKGEEGRRCCPQRWGWCCCGGPCPLWSPWPCSSSRGLLRFTGEVPLRRAMCSRHFDEGAASAFRPSHIHRGPPQVRPSGTHGVYYAFKPSASKEIGGVGGGVAGGDYFQKISAAPKRQL